MITNLVYVLIALLAVSYIFSIVRKGGLSIDESFFWAVGSITMLGLAIYPKVIDKLASFVGVSYPPSLLFVGCIIFLLLMNIRLSKKVAILQEKTIRLAQDLAMMKNTKKTKK